MKRLIKSELFTAIQRTNGDYIECFKNPTPKEWDIAYKFNTMDDVKGIVLEDGTVFGWNGTLLHTRAIIYFNLPDGVHFSGNKNVIDIYATKSTTPQYMKNAFTNASSFFNFFSTSTRVDEIYLNFYKAQSYDAYDNFLMINDILNYNEVDK